MWKCPNNAGNRCTCPERSQQRGYFRNVPEVVPVALASTPTANGIYRIYEELLGNRRGMSRGVYNPPNNNSYINVRASDTAIRAGDLVVGMSPDRMIVDEVGTMRTNALNELADRVQQEYIAERDRTAENSRDRYRRFYMGEWDMPDSTNADF